MRNRLLLLFLFLASLVLLSAIGFWYADDRGIPPAIAAAVLPAFLLEITLYLLSGVPRVRDGVASLGKARAALLLTALAPVSWLLLTVPLNSFSPVAYVVLIGLAAAASFWYVVLPHRLPADLGYLVLMAAPVLLGVFDVVYPDPAERLPGKALGAVMWYRTGLLAVLCIRRMEGIGFGFVPSRAEWRTGTINFVLFLPVAVVLALLTGFAELRDVAWEPRTLLLAVLTFVGVLWVLAVAEEFFFRGLLQQQLSALFRSPALGLVLASAVFGAAHLGYREFPNWRFALLAAVAGVFYGRAYQQAGTIRSAMVTHALVVTVWKVFFT